MRPALAVLLGLLIGLVPGLFIRSIIRVIADHPRGLTLTPVAVTTRALPAGHVLTMDDVMHASLPDALVTASILKPQEVSYVVNQKLLVPLAPRDPLPWAAFETMPSIEGNRPAQELIDACSAEMERRKVPAAPSSVAALRTAILEAP
jgi:flagella basal body P-ring formation protein FlgA